jgi:hypothetical protein
MAHLASWTFIVLTGAGVGIGMGLFGVGGSSVGTPVLALLSARRLARRLCDPRLCQPGRLNPLGGIDRAMTPPSRKKTGETEVLVGKRGPRAPGRSTAAAVPPTAASPRDPLTA